MDWLSAVPGSGSRNVTVLDQRREASLAISYIINWGDGAHSSGTATPLSHTYSEEGLYSITVRIAYRDGSINIFTAWADVRGNNCSFQMFAEDFIPALTLLGALAFIAGLIMFATKKTKVALKPQVRRRLARYLFVIVVAVFGFIVAMALYASVAGIPI